MDKVGLSFRSHLTPDEVMDQYIRPLREALQRDSAGGYSNYLRQIDPDSDEPNEHLLVFQVNDFKEGLRSLRLAAEALDMPRELSFQNLNPSQPGF